MLLTGIELSQSKERGRKTMDTICCLIGLSRCIIGYKVVCLLGCKVGWMQYIKKIRESGCQDVRMSGYHGASESGSQGARV